MKNVFLGLALMLMGTFAFANTTKIENRFVKEVGTCTYTITTTVTTSTGFTYSYNTEYQVEANSLTDCISIANAHVNRLNGLSL